MSNKKKHHYNPEFYLEAWVDPSSPSGQEPYLWQADLRKRTVRNKAPSNVAWSPYFYAVDTVNGKHDQSVEDLLANIESDGAPVIKKLRGSEFVLSQQERSFLANFMGFQITRSPSSRAQVEDFWSRILDNLTKQHASDPAVFAASVREWEQATGETLGIPTEEARIRILNNYYTIRADPSVSLIPILHSSHTPASLLFQMRWAFAIAPEGATFPTTDFPVFWTDPTAKPPDVGVGLAAPNIQLTFPISPKLCLLASWRGCEGMLKISRELFEKVNQHIRYPTSRFAFSQTRSGAELALSLAYDKKAKQ